MIVGTDLERRTLRAVALVNEFTWSPYHRLLSREEGNSLAIGVGQVAVGLLGLDDEGVFHNMIGDLRNRIRNIRSSHPDSNPEEPDARFAMLDRAVALLPANEELEEL